MRLNKATKAKIQDILADAAHQIIKLAKLNHRRYVTVSAKIERSIPDSYTRKVLEHASAMVSSPMSKAAQKNFKEAMKNRIVLSRKESRELRKEIREAEQDLSPMTTRAMRRLLLGKKTRKQMLPKADYKKLAKELGWERKSKSSSKRKSLVSSPPTRFTPWSKKPGTRSRPQPKPPAS